MVDDQMIYIEFCKDTYLKWFALMSIVNINIKGQPKWTQSFVICGQGDVSMTKIIGLKKQGCL